MDCLGGLRENGYILINTAKTFAQLGLQDWVERLPAQHLCTVPATEIALRHVGRPVPNVPLLGGFAAISQLLHIDSVIKAIEDRFSGKVALGNVAAATEAYEYVQQHLSLGA